LSANLYSFVRKTKKEVAMKIIIDGRGPNGRDKTCLEMCHFEDPQTPKLCEVIDFAIAKRGDLGSIKVFETYDKGKGEFGRPLAKFEYKDGVLIKSLGYGKIEDGCHVVSEDIEALKEKRVILVSVAGGMVRFDYHLCLVE